MPLDFTVVVRVRQRFGDNKSDDIGLEVEAPFVGVQKDFEFQCPNVDRNQEAILLFQSQGVNVAQSLEINGQTIFGGIPTSVDLTLVPGSSSGAPFTIVSLARWLGNVMIVHPGVLQASNVLRIRAGKIGDTSNVDNFVIDNVVVLFKTVR